MKPEEIVKEVRVFVVDGVDHEKGIVQHEARRKSPRLLQVPKVDYKDVKRPQAVREEMRDDEPPSRESDETAKPKSMDRSPFEKPLEDEAIVSEELGQNNQAKAAAEARDKDDTQESFPHESGKGDAPNIFADKPWVAEPKTLVESKRKFEKYRKYFPGIPLDIIKKTFKVTTQMGRIGAIPGYNLKHRLKSLNPALSIPRRNEPVATDTVYGPRGVPAVDDGSTAAQFFIGRRSMYRTIRPLSLIHISEPTRPY